VNPQSLFGQDEQYPLEDAGGVIRKSNPSGSYPCPTPPDDDGVDPKVPSPVARRSTTRSNSDSSNDSKGRSRKRQKKGSPFLPPKARWMAGGADPNNANPRRQKTDQEIFAAAMAAFKCKVDIKGMNLSRTRQSGFIGGASSRLLSPVRD
jgi:hypothetical protein